MLTRMSEYRGHAIDALTADSEKLPPEPDSVVSGNPEAYLATFGTLDNATYGIWDLTPGAIRGPAVDEVFVVVAGAGTITRADGEVLTLKPGVVVRCYEGEIEDWVITERLRKVWVITR